MGSVSIDLVQPIVSAKHESIKESLREFRFWPISEEFDAISLVRSFY